MLWAKKSKVWRPRRATYLLDKPKVNDNLSTTIIGLISNKRSRMYYDLVKNCNSDHVLALLKKTFNKDSSFSGAICVADGAGQHRPAKL